MRYNQPINLKLYTYENSQFKLQAVIDDYQEISFAHNIYEAGDFTITINYNIPNALKFERGMWIQFGNDSYMFGEILKITDAIGEDGKGSQIRTIAGKDARFIFKRRIIKNLNNEENWVMTAKGEICLRELIKAQCGSGAEAKRQLPITNTIPDSASAIGKEYSVAESFSNLYDTLVTIATQSEIGWRVKFDGTLTLEVYEGTDRSQTVQFSTNFDSLSSGEFTDSAESYANTVYVGGKGTGADRDIYEGEENIDGVTPTGLDRYEAWDNQSSMTSESEYEAEAFSMLTQYGQTLNISGQGLAECPYIFKENYNIGDIITLAFSGKSAKAQILSVTEHWVWGQYGIEFSFGKPQNDLSRQLQLILKQIQKASNKTETTSSVKYYTIPTDTSQPKADVIYNTIGFQGDCGSGATFQLYYDSEKTGAKTYHIWLKQLAGGKLTLSTGVSGATNLVLNSGTYVAIIYVDASGNVLSQSATATNTIEADNTQPATSGGVAQAISTEVTDRNTAILNALAIPTDAVLHYSFDEVPDYPDGSAVYFRNKNFTGISDWSYNSSRTTPSIDNGSLKLKSTGETIYVQIWGTQTSATNMSNKILVMNFYCENLNYVALEDNGGNYTQKKLTVKSLGNNRYSVCQLLDSSYSYTQMFRFVFGSISADNYVLIDSLYIGDGSYSTPIIDNANGKFNAVNNGGLAVQGVSGKGAYFLNGKYASISTSLLPAPTSNDNLSISLWLKLDSNYIDDSTDSGKPVCSIGAFTGCFGITRSSRIIAMYLGDATITRIVKTSTLNLNEWYHIVMTFDGTSHLGKLYLNGALIGTSGTLSANYQFGSDYADWRIWSNLYIYSNVATSTNQPATIDDILFFNRALSDTEVQALYQNKANTPKYYDLSDYKLKEVKDNAQPQTLATPITIGGQSYTTVESALQALAGAI